MFMGMLDTLWKDLTSCVAVNTGHLDALDWGY